jgi:hypothetical protein
MSTWTLEIEVAWPQDIGAQAWEALIREVVDPLHRDNIVVSDVRLVQTAEDA